MAPLPIIAMTQGPSLEQYLETRFGLLNKVLEDRAAEQDAALRTALVANQAVLVATKLAMESAAIATDLRYQQRFEAQSDALAAAFASQQMAMQTAMLVAEKAVAAALAAQDRAQTKAETSSDKRFESVNEFRQTLADQQRMLMPRQEADRAMLSLSDRLVALKEIIDRLTAERVGIKGGWGYAVGVVGFVLTLLAIGTFIFQRVKP